MELQVVSSLSKNVVGVRIDDGFSRVLEFRVV
jgi:hypothetical protein